MSLVNVYETEFVLRSLMAWGKKLLLSLFVFAIMLLKRLPAGSKQKRCSYIYIYIYIYTHIYIYIYICMCVCVCVCVCSFVLFI